MEGTRHRRSIRLPGCDYSVPGFYFVTICTQNRECLFGEIKDGGMQLNECGKIVLEKWNDLPNYFVHLIADEFVVMPNHIHGIIGIVDTGRGGVSPPQSPCNDIARHDQLDQGAETAPLPKIRTHPTLGQIVAYFKYQTTKIMNADVRNAPKIKIWQRNYYEHIVRNQASLEKIRIYIRSNPFNWDMDEENPFLAKIRQK